MVALKQFTTVIRFFSHFACVIDHWTAQIWPRGPTNTQIFFQWTHSILYLQLVKSEMWNYGYWGWLWEHLCVLVSAVGPGTNAPDTEGTILCVCVFSSLQLYHMDNYCATTVKIQKTSIITGSLVLPFYHSIHLLLHPPSSHQFLILGNCQSCFHFYDFVISRMLHEWNHHVVYNLWKISFLIQHNSLSTHPSCISFMYTTFLLSSIS